MAMDQSRIGHLLSVWYSGAATEAEMAELYRWASEQLAPADAFSDFVIAKLEEAGAADVAHPEVDWAALYQRTQAEIRRNEPVSPERGRIIRPWRWVAAAILIVLAGGAAYWFQPRTDKPVPSVRIVQKDVKPGVNKAVLTLAGGRQLVLDETHTGELARQGGTIVKKTDSGRLDYAAAAGSGPVVHHTLTTPRGGQYQLVLPDGTKAWLNAASSITYPTRFVGEQRAVQITGEVYFEVSANASKPFSVQTGSMTVSVLGTAFDVNAYSDEPNIRTTLTQGRVKVGIGREALILEPGQQAVAQSNGAIGMIKDADVEQAVAWTDGRFIFQRDNIQSIMRQLARWYDVEVVFREDMSKAHYSGIISRSRNLSDVLKMLATTGNIHFIIEEKKIIIMH